MDTQDLFFGREKELETFRNGVFFPKEGSNGICAALCGPHGIGKTYLLNRLMREYEAVMEAQDDRRSFCFYLPMSAGAKRSENPLTDLQSDLLSQFCDVLPLETFELELAKLGQAPHEVHEKGKRTLERLNRAYRLVGPDGVRGPDSPQYLWWKREINKCFTPGTALDVFHAYTFFGFRIILILDEFDRAEERFPDGDIFSWLFSLSNKGGKGLDLNLSIVVVSRRTPHLFVHGMEKSSDFEAAYNPEVMHGFTNRDLDGEDGYFASFPAQAAARLTGPVKQQIQYYCGRHPALLMRLREKILAVKGDAPLDIDALCLKDEGFMRAYNKMCQQMESAPQLGQENVTLIDAFMYRFVYFAAGADSSTFENPDQKLYMERLVNAGFAMEPEWDKDAITDGACVLYPDIFYRAGQKSRENIGTKVMCEPLSPFFLTYIERRWKPDKSKGAAQHLSWTERALRAFLEDRLRARYKDYWLGAVRAALTPTRQTDKMDAYMKSLELLAQQNNYDGDLSGLDVLSFLDYYSIIEYNWGPVFAACFTDARGGSTITLVELKKHCEFLYGCRNAKAHENIKVLNLESLRRVEQVCSLLDAVIERNA